MKQELIKPIVKVGNSAGVILPKEWLNGRAKIELVEKPLNIKKDILEILSKYLCDIQGIYLVGSYAREEQTSESDIDVLVITQTLNKKIEQGKYNLILISKNEVENSLKQNIIPLLPMLKEAKPLLNATLIENYKNTSLSKINLKWHIETTKSAMDFVEKDIDISKELNEKNTSDASAYSLVLRLRGVYLVNCLMKNKKWSNKELKLLIKKTTGSLKVYEGYLRVKNKQKSKIKENIPPIEAEKLHTYILKKIKEQKKWLKERKD